MKVIKELSSKHQKRNLQIQTQPHLLHSHSPNLDSDCDFDQNVAHAPIVPREPESQLDPQEAHIDPAFSPQFAHSSHQVPPSDYQEVDHLQQVLYDYEMLYGGQDLAREFCVEQLDSVSFFSRNTIP